MNNIRLGSNLKSLLRAKGLSLKTVSAKTGIPYSTLHTWLENRQPKNIIKVKALADFFGISLQALIFGDDNERLLTGLTTELPKSEPDDALVGVYEVTVRRRE